MDDSWIKIYRKIQDWEWYTDSHMVHLFIHLLLTANTCDGKWRGIDVKRGQLIGGRALLSGLTGMSEQNVRTCLKRLVEANEITIESTRKYSIITICNYEQFAEEQKLIQQPPDECEEKEEIENPPLPPKKPKKPKNPNTLKETLPKRRQEFYNSLVPFLEKYDKRIIREFYDYWSETNASLTKMRWELEKTWVTSRRLATWAARDNNFSKDGNNGNNPTREERLNGAASLVDKYLNAEK